MNEPTPDSDSLRTRASLIERVKNLEDARSWAEFFGIYENLVRAYARRCHLRDHEVEEVAQEVFKRIARTIHDFQPGERPGSFRNWLRRLTRWRAGDVLRERTRSPDSPTNPAEGDTPLVERLPAPPDPALAFESEARRHLLAELFRRLDGKVSPRHLQIFQLLVVENLPVERVAEMYGMTPTNLYVLRHRVLEKLRAEARRIPLAWD
jgi:RNA polymerase sigma-70 factor (ECF subfamily)